MPELQVRPVVRPLAGGHAGCDEISDICGWRELSATPKAYWINSVISSASRFSLLSFAGN
jgi:hypothetical protein